MPVVPASLDMDMDELLGATGKVLSILVGLWAVLGSIWALLRPGIDEPPPEATNRTKITIID